MPDFIFGAITGGTVMVVALTVWMVWKMRTDAPLQAFLTGACWYYMGVAILGFCLHVMSGRRA